LPGSSRVPRPVLVTLGGAFPLNQGGMAGLLPSVTSAAAHPAPVHPPCSRTSAEVLVWRCTSIKASPQHGYETG